ncbi:MAG: hypothetical protein K0R71_1960 [Bacillales bacterium]|jgi:hypothetical protein|nr:hypothetical protein [Bacillales bacterium]
MVGLIILITMAFVAYFIFTITKTKIMKFILAPIISLLYGIMLFFIGMGISDIVFLALVLLPVIIVIFYLILMKIKK